MVVSVEGVPGCVGGLSASATTEDPTSVRATITMGKNAEVFMSVVFLEM